MQVKKSYNQLFICLILLIFSLQGCENIIGSKNIPQMKIGKPAPDFVLQDVSGKSWKLSDQKGKVIFLNFWATWCKPCRDEMPSMVSLDRAMADKQFQMLTIVFNDDHKVADNFARQLGATFPVLSNPSPELNEAYMITGVPETFIIDADGILLQNSSAPITGIHGRREI
jgi:peroxiredoxin